MLTRIYTNLYPSPDCYWIIGRTNSDLLVEPEYEVHYKVCSLVFRQCTAEWHTLLLKMIGSIDILSA